MENTQEKLNQGEFLQSPEWRKFQKSFGRKTHCVLGDGFFASIVEHELPLVGKYFYVPRGPIISCNTQHETCNKGIQELINLAKKEKAGWVRIDPENERFLETIRSWTSDVRMQNGHPMSIKKAPHDMQPKEIFVMDIAKSEEEILAGMKAKTRYNIRLAEKKGVVLRNTKLTKYEITNKDVDEFIRLTKVMAKRQGITAHPEEYYRKMLEVIPGDILKLYIAEYQGKIIAANLVVFYGKTGIYLHGASDDEFRNVMAPYLLQWRQIQDAKVAGCEKYEMGGIKTRNTQHETRNKSWQGITRFKLGFSPETQPTIFPGSYDIVVNPMKYNLYRIIQKLKSFL